VDDELWEKDVSRVGVPAASTGDGDEVVFERISATATWVMETFVLLLDTTSGFVALLAAECSAIDNCCEAESLSRARLSTCHVSHFHSSR
jgi:hypothetical protein